MILFRLDTKSGVPAYIQIAQQLKHALLVGTIQPGEQLPTVKEVVSQLAINPNTVFRAYHELEHEGLVVGRAGSGTFATDKPPKFSASAQQQLTDRLQEWIADAKTTGLDAETITLLMQEALHNDNPKEGKK